MSKKAIAMALAATMFTSFNPSLVMAAERESTDNITVTKEESIDNVLSAEKNNYNYIEGEIGDKHLVYTYESNGSTYKVIEDISDNYDEVNTVIYLQDSNGEYSEFATQNFKIENNTYTLTTNADGVVTIDEQDMGISLPSFDEDHEMPSVFANETYQGYDVTNWQLLDSHNSSTAIHSYTISAVTALVVFIATDGMTGAAAAAGAAVGSVVTRIIEENTPTLYYKQSYYEKNLVNPPLPLRNFVYGSRWFTNYYEDSNHRYYINYTDISKCVE